MTKMADKKGVKQQKTGQAISEKRAVLNDIMRKAESRFGKKVIRLASEASNTYYLRRPSGIMQLDLDTGGGLPAGGMSTISGKDGAGKSLLLYKYFAMNQKLYGRESYIAYAPTEGGIDFEWARKIGWIIPVPDETIEAWRKNRFDRGLPDLTKDEIRDLKTEIGTNVRVDGNNGEQILDNLLTIIQSNLFQIVALDSIDAIIPSAEAELDSLSDNPQQAARATILTRFAQRYWPSTSGLDGANYTTFIATCQVRSNRNKSQAPSYMAKYLPDFLPSTPSVIRHARLIDVMLSNREKIKSKVNGEKVQTGKVIAWEINKGKAGTHEGITGEIEFDFESYTNDYKSILTTGIQKGVIVEEKGLLTLHKNSGEDEVIRSIPGEKKFIELLANDFNLELMVRREILAAAGKQCIYR